MIHDVTFSTGKWDNDQLLKILAVKPASIEVHSLQQLKEIQIMGEDLPPVSIKVRNLDDVDQLSAFKVDGLVISADVNDPNRLEVVESVQEAVNMGFEVRAMIPCDLTSSGASSAITVGGMIGDFADAGASTIMLENRGETTDDLDEDTVREILEEGLYLDVSGDPIKQRLGLYAPLPAGEKCLKVAIELGCLQFVTTTETQEQMLQLLP